MFEDWKEGKGSCEKYVSCMYENIQQDCRFYKKTRSYDA